MMTNHWFKRAWSKGQRAETTVLDALFDLPAHEARQILENIRDYDGTKIVVSCTEETDLESLLKLSLCLASSTIIVPAPLWVSCDEQTRYGEFNYCSVGTNGWNSAMEVHRKISDIAARVPRLFEDGVVTFLPVLGESLHRWSDPELDLPELPSPYSTARSPYTALDIHLEALYGMCSERLVAERLGAIHLNSASFLSPVLNDFWIQSKVQPDNWKCEPVEICVPDFTLLSLSTVSQLRQEFAADFLLLATALRNVLQPRHDSGQNVEQALEDRRVLIANLSSRIGSALAGHMTAKHETRPVRIYALGNNGGVTHAVNFLLAGGGFHDFINQITANHRLKIRDSSLLSALQSS